MNTNFRGGRAGNGSTQLSSAVDLYWIPLGAGEHVVRVSGKVFEALSAMVQRRRPCDLYHSALTVTVPEGRFVIEMAPVVDRHGDQRGVVAEGPVGMKLAGRFWRFRYEIRRWRGGVIPDTSEVVSTVKVEIDLVRARRLLELAAAVPTPVWGRDDLDAGEMWNSNSVTSWLLSRAQIDIAQIYPPPGGRAPGWSAGLAVAARDVERAERIALQARDGRRRGGRPVKCERSGHSATRAS